MAGGRHQPEKSGPPPGALPLPAGRSGFEIERRFLLTRLPERTTGAPSVFVSQGWLPGEAIQERLRRTEGIDGEQYVRAIKAGRGMTRIEVEEIIPRSLFEDLWPLTEGHRISKRRYLIEDGALTWEIDEFEDFPLVLAEVEIPTESTVVEPPEWLAPLIEEEVTGRPEYLNINLALHGPPERSR